MIRLIEIISLFAIIQALPELKISFDRLQELVEKVNTNQTTWTAGINFDYRDERQLDLSHTVGTILHRGPKSRDSGDTSTHCKNDRLPAHFDARKRWKKCRATLNHVYDQGNCGSCWAVAVASAFADRLCIKSKGKNTSLRSSQQLISCCSQCGYGCEGGRPMDAWKYLKSEGEATGGDYNSKEGCQPYLLAPCAHHVNGTDLKLCNVSAIAHTPKCEKKCSNENYKFSYDEDKVKVQSVYEIDPCDAQNEIYRKGPIVATFAVFEDFLTYKSGVYTHVTGNLVGYHAVRVLGWGVENDIPYWLVVNSWNKSWGNDGVFKVLRGDNEVMFEEYFSAGDP